MFLVLPGFRNCLFCKIKTHAVLEQEVDPVFYENAQGCFCFCLVARQVKPQFMSLNVFLRMSSPLRRQVTAVVAIGQRANTTHVWLPRLWHCPARHQQTSFDDRASFIDTCSLKFLVIFFFETVQYNFVRNGARTCVCCFMMPATACHGKVGEREARAVNARKRALCDGQRDLLGPTK